MTWGFRVARLLLVHQACRVTVRMNTRHAANAVFGLTGLLQRIDGLAVKVGGVSVLARLETIVPGLFQLLPGLGLLLRRHFFFFFFLTFI